MLTPEEFEARFKSWFEFPAEILTGSPSDNSQRAAARALHSEILKSNSAWFRALASRRVGSIGNWAIVVGYLAALARQAAAMMQAAQPVNGASQGSPEPQPEPQAAGVNWPPKF